jgi:hypothetical protein
VTLRLGSRFEPPFAGGQQLIRELESLGLKLG